MKKRKPKHNNSLLLTVIVIILAIMATIIILNRPKKVVPIKIIKKKPEIMQVALGPKIAFVLDDWGYNLKNEKFIKDKNMPFTLAILPNLKYSTTVAKLAYAHNKEIVLHLPLEPKNKQDGALENNTILTTMDKDKIQSILINDLKTVPHAKGASNHQGSRATEDEKIMAYIFNIIKKRNLYFLDSRSTQDSICRELSKKMKVRFAERAVFIDNKNELDYIKSQIRQLMRIAKVRKAAIGIGHDRELTLQAIKEMLPEIKKQGIKLVFVSQILKKW
ncbi:MAG: divergent polysaccharide deacetylase family protein [Candidatus Omnitrophota bacterium]